jgi:hypothetical protein
MSVRCLLFLLVLLVLLVPAASAVTVGVDNPTGPTETTLYFHIADALNDFPISTAPPVDLAGPAGGQLSTTHSLCLSAADPATTLASKQYHTYYGFSTPDAVDMGGAASPSQSPMNRGLGTDLELGSDSATLEFYLAGSAGPTPIHPTAVPNVVVRATVRTGSAISVDDTTYNGGRVLMRGESEPALLAGAATTGASFESVAGRDVYGFSIPLDIESNNTTARDGFNVRIDVFVENPACSEPGSHFMPDVVVPYIDADHVSRLVVQARSPVSILSVSPSFLQHGVAVTVKAVSPWGGYDVDAATVNATITGPSTAANIYLADHSPPSGQAPRELTFFWPNEQDQAEGGLYAVTVSLQNLQGTAVANATAAFDLRDGSIYPAVAGSLPAEIEGASSQESPGAGFLVLLAAIGAALLARANKA